MDVTIVIVSWNTCEILRDCLESVFEQTKKIRFEVIVVDNASDDGSADMVKEVFPNVCLIENTTNRGFAGANNQGIALAKGRYVLLLNSDTLILSNAIATVTTYMDQQPDVGICGCRILNKDLTLQYSCFMFPSLYNLLLSFTYMYKMFPKSKVWGREKMTWWNRDDIREVDVVTGCFMLVRCESLSQVGVFDETFFMFGEETDWCYRFKQTGWRVLFNPYAEIIHLGGCSTKQVKLEMILQLRSGILQFMKKHYGVCQYGIACLLTSFFFCVRIPYWFCQYMLSRRHPDAGVILRAYCQGAYKALRGWEALKTK